MNRRTCPSVASTVRLPRRSRRSQDSNISGRPLTVQDAPNPQPYREEISRDPSRPRFGENLDQTGAMRIVCVNDQEGIQRPRLVVRRRLEACPKPEAFRGDEESRSLPLTATEPARPDHPMPENRFPRCCLQLVGRDASRGLTESARLLPEWRGCSGSVELQGPSPSRGTLRCRPFACEATGPISSGIQPCNGRS